MKRCLSLLLSIVILLLPCGITVNADNNLSGNSESMLAYLNDNNNDLLIKRNNYAYMKLGAKWYSDIGVNYCLQMADLLIDTGSCPDKEKYMEVLINIIAVHDMDNASEISSQKKQDNLKSLKDYGMDAVKMATDAVSVYSGLDGIKGELSNSQEVLSKAIDGVSVLIDNTNNWIDTLTDLETFTQDYSNYNSFLKCIEDNSDGDLKEAAATLRNSMKQAFLLKLEAYGNVTAENFNNYTQFFFDDIFFDAVKSSDEYNTDEAFSFFVNSGEELYERLNILKDSWELGKDIGKLIGNTVGAENLINRTLEIEALYDISIILQTKVLDTTTDFLNHSVDSDADKYIDEYVTYANFLIGCRIRGEYCTYTILTEDSGLLALLSDKTNAQNWYDEQSSTIMILKDRINSIKTSTVSTPTNEYTAKDLINKPVKEIIETMNNSFEISDAGVDTLYYFYNYDKYPGMNFHVTYSGKDNDKLKSVIQNGYIDLEAIEVHDDGKGCTHDGKIITADMDFSQVSEIYGKIDCEPSSGAYVSGALSAIAYEEDYENSTVTINFETDTDIAKIMYAAAENNRKVPYSDVISKNPKIKNIVVKKDYYDKKYKIQSDKIQKYNDKIYYTSEFGHQGLSGKIDMSSVGNEYAALPKFSDKQIDSFVIYNDKIYFTDEEEGTSGVTHSKLYSCDLDGSNIETISNDTDRCFELEANTIKFSTNGNQQVYRYDLSDKSVKAADGESPYFTRSRIFNWDSEWGEENSERYLDGEYYKVFDDTQFPDVVQYYRRDIKTGESVKIGSGFTPQA